MTVRNNILANYFGQGWRVFVGLAFIPVYIKYLGMESYGLIGIYAILQTWMSVLDMGMRPVLAREMARYSAGGRGADSIADLLKSVQILAAAIACSVAAVIWNRSTWLATNWVHPNTLPVQTVANAFAIMGLLVGMRFMESLYISTLSGLQRQVTLNLVQAAASTVQALGAIGVLAFLSASVTAFFLWQAFISLASMTVLSVIVHLSLPRLSRRARFSVSAFLEIRGFAVGMVAIAILTVCLTQVDKILLSRLLSLRAFGTYALASTVAGALYAITAPISSAFYPRLTEIVTVGDNAALRATYHQAAQLVSVATGSAAAALIVLGDRIVGLWTGNPQLTGEVMRILPVLSLGTLLNALMWMPYQLQLAHGWTSLTIKINVAAVIVIVPAIFLVVPVFGAVGAAWIWFALNASYLIIGISLMHRRLLSTEKWRWYAEDVIMPVAAAMVAALACRWMFPKQLNTVLSATWLALSAAAIVASSAIAARRIRLYVSGHMLRILGIRL